MLLQPNTGEPINMEVNWNGSKVALDSFFMRTSPSAKLHVFQRVVVNFAAYSALKMNERAVIRKAAR